MEQKEQANATGKKAEKDYYEPIKSTLEELLNKKFSKVHLELTANRNFSNKLKAEITKHGNRDIIFSFLREAAPDITGFVVEDGTLSKSTHFIIVEIKNEEIKLDDIYQTRKYAELFDAKYALLVSTKETPEEIKRLSKVVLKLLYGGWGYEKLTLVHFNEENQKLVGWFDKNPFKNAAGEEDIFEE